MAAMKATILRPRGLGVPAPAMASNSSYGFKAGIGFRGRARSFMPCASPGPRSLRLICTGKSKDDSDVKGGFQLLEWAGKIVPQSSIVKGAKFTWKTTWLAFMRELAPQDTKGAYTRPKNAFADVISDAPGAKFPLESGRYHLYTGNACPWCHRCLLVIAVRGLSNHISVGRLMDDAEKARRGGWIFASGRDPITGSPDMLGVYEKARPGYIGRCTAPVLFDKKTMTIVSNESSDIVRMLNDLDFGDTGPSVDLYPEPLREDIDRLNNFVYHRINNGTYKSGFATTQQAYDIAQKELWSGLAEVESILATQRFLVGDRFTEADLRMFPTLMRFDSAYAVLFKCSRFRIMDYEHISAWLRDVYQLSCNENEMQIADTFDMDDARRSYFEQLFPLNPGGIVPAGPTLKDLGLDRPPNRGSQAAEDVFYFK